MRHTLNRCVAGGAAPGADEKVHWRLVYDSGIGVGEPMTTRREELPGELRLAF